MIDIETARDILSRRFGCLVSETAWTELPLFGGALDRIGTLLGRFTHRLGCLLQLLGFYIRLATNAVALLVDRTFLGFSRIFSRFVRAVARGADSLVGTIAFISLACRRRGVLVLRGAGLLGGALTARQQSRRGKSVHDRLHH
ncbi:MAG: hypothetical protein Q7T60_07380 [Sphingopyxis sp.]|nr:hypothetical protein [Sphingopyxis sp.]